MQNSVFIKTVAILLIISMFSSTLFAQYEATQVSSPDPVAQEDDKLDIAPEADSSKVTFQAEKDYEYARLLEARIAGERDAKGNILFGLGGFAAGLTGIIIAGIYTPKPDAEYLQQLFQEKGAEYTEAYSKSYSKKSKNKNLRNAGIGWGVSAAVSIYIAYRISKYLELEDDW